MTEKKNGKPVVYITGATLDGNSLKTGAELDREEAVQALDLHISEGEQAHHVIHGVSRKGTSIHESVAKRLEVARAQGVSIMNLVPKDEEPLITGEPGGGKGWELKKRILSEVNRGVPNYSDGGDR